MNIPATKAEVLTYFDATGLFGTQANPPPESDGNPWLDTATCLAIMKARDELDDGDRQRFRRAYEACQVGGMISKNPGNPDQITHDDLYGLVTGARLCDFDDIVDDLVVYAHEHGWVLSNTGQWYWDAEAKPWQQAFYMLCSTTTLCPLWQHLSFFIQILINAFFSVSSDVTRQTWIQLVGVKGRSAFIDVAIQIWNWKFSKAWLTLSSLFAVYYQDSNHILARYAAGISPV